MKNLTKFALAFISLISLVSCGEKTSTSSTTSSSTTETTSTIETTTTTTEDESTSSIKILATYTVTFNYGYTGKENTTASVTEGSSVTRPTDPTRSGYTFNGWYIDSECTELYDFNSEVTGDLTLYASWLEGDVSDFIKVTYYLNYEGAPNSGVYNVVYIEKLNRVTRPTSPSRDGYYFLNWYKETDCTTTFDFNEVYGMNVTSVDLYAYWATLYTFEAEDVDFTDKNGYGYSANVSETAMIEEDQDDLAASNGFFVSYLYYNGAYLEWKINASKDISNVVLLARLSAEFFDIEVNPNTYDVKVNDVSLSGYDISLTGVEGTMKKLVFQDYLISTTVSLKQGDNSIKLITNNENSHTQTAGTYHAEAPMIDCIKLATNETISWASGYPISGNYKK